MLDLRKLNSATKYPSIETYHKMGSGGRLEEVINGPVPEPGSPVIMTEKIDGTNGRIILLPGDDWIIASREELLTAKGDRISPTTMGIVQALRWRADRLTRFTQADTITVVYGEVYGAKENGPAWKNYEPYAGTRDAAEIGRFRVFDVAVFTPKMMGLFDMDIQDIAMWRDQGKQPFLGFDDMCGTAVRFDLDLAPINSVKGAEYIPETVEDTHTFLQALSVKARLSDAKKMEGLVVRTGDRKWIRKIRLEDYQRTLRAKSKTGGLKDGVR